MNIVQIGTNRAYDNLASIVYQYSPEIITNLILVEPFSLHNHSIQSCYAKYIDKLHLENIIISDSDAVTNKLWYHPNDLTHQNAAELASLNKQHSINIRSYYKEDEVVCLELPNLTANQLFDKYNLNNIDILYIDTEGFDDRIIYSINFDKYYISTIYYENLHIDRDKLRAFLSQLNYKIDINTNNDPYCDLAILGNNI
jgi:hypothetical protein